MNAKSLINKYGDARKVKGTAESYVRRIVEGEAIAPPLATVAAAVGAAGYRSGSFSDTPRTQMIRRWYESAVHRKQTKGN